MEEKNVLSPPKSETELRQAMEAILFAAGYPVRYDKLSEVLQTDVKSIKKSLSEMEKHFKEPDTEHGIQLLLYPTSAQLTTKENYAVEVREALGIRRGGNLSASSMEVLAVAAYNQPVTRSFIDAVRGVDSSYAVNSLLDKGLLEAAGRLDAPGRPMLYVTTDKFLRVFGINSLDELPETEALSAAAGQFEEQLKIREEDASPPTEAEPEPKDYTAPSDPEENQVIFENGVNIDSKEEINE